MTIASKLGIKAVRTVDIAINTSMLTIILLLFAFGSFALWDTNQVLNIACSSRYERYRPTSEEGSISFAALKEINPDVFAWLNVFGTNIDYPVVQGPDNWFYVNTNAHLRHSIGGAIFLDYRNSRHFTDFVSTLHGHHMANQIMFGEISSFSNEDFFNARRHGTLYFDGVEKGIEFFAFINVDAHDANIYFPTLNTTQERQNHIDMIRRIAIHQRTDVIVTPESRIVQLSTCSPRVSHMRDVLIGIITDDVQPDPFYYYEDTLLTAIIALANIDILPDFWLELEPWQQLTISIFVFLLILLVSVVTFGKRRVALVRKRRATAAAQAIYVAPS